MEGKEKEYQYIADVRCLNEWGKNKLLFRLSQGDDGISIIIKGKGNNQMLEIPIRILLEPFSRDLEYLQKYWEILGRDLNFTSENKIIIQLELQDDHFE